MGRNGRKANGKWIDRWREGGVQHQRTFDRKADRDRFRDERRRRQQLGGLVADVLAADVTLGEFMEDYWRLYAIPNLERNTRDAYRQQWAKHLHPRVGGYRLRQLSGKVINRELVETMRNAGVGAPTIRKALAVQSILSYAVAEERLEHNPVARVAKPSALRDREVPPIPPLVVERLRARLELRDATMISLLAYAGLRPQELLALKVDDVTERKLLVRRKVVDGELLPYTKTKRHRPVTLLAPALPQDVRSHMLASGIRDGLLFGHDVDRAPWRTHDWNNWRKRVYQANAGAVGLDGGVPYDLRGSFASLLVWEGRTMLEVAAELGHGVQTCERYYARIFADYDPAKRTSAEVAIRQARAAVAGRAA